MTDKLAEFDSEINRVDKATESVRFFRKHEDSLVALRRAKDLAVTEFILRKKEEHKISKEQET